MQKRVHDKRARRAARCNKSSKLAGASSKFDDTDEQSEQTSKRIHQTLKLHTVMDTQTPGSSIRGPNFSITIHCEN